MKFKCLNETVKENNFFNSKLQFLKIVNLLKRLTDKQDFTLSTKLDFVHQSFMCLFAI